MASNRFGTQFTITTWGESHGRAIGVVIDGCPAGIELAEEDLDLQMQRRAPGKCPFTSPRRERDRPEILSGLFEGKTTGAPISIIIENGDVDSSKYEPIKELIRPGHASFTYLEKYGCFDWRGGGRSSARETACRVAAGAVAKKFLQHQQIEVSADLCQVGGICGTLNDAKVIAALESAMRDGDSLGGVVAFTVTGVPAGLGEPIYEKLEAKLALALLSIPASKGFEIGEGFAAAGMRGSQHNDGFACISGAITPTTNRAGGALGGISTGLPITGRVAFKPTSSIQIAQQSVDQQGNSRQFALPEGSRHDPCVALRAVPVVEAMVALVVADLLLLNRSSRV